MKVDCFGCSAGTAVVISLLINLISNNILWNGIGSEFLKHKLAENVFQFHSYFILLQTILSVFAIIIVTMFKIHSSSVTARIIKIQVWLLGFIVASLIYEIVVIFLFSVGTMVLQEDFDVNKQATASFHVFIFMLPIFFLGLKLHAATVTFGYRLEISEQEQISIDVSNDTENGYFHSRQQLVTSSSSSTVTSLPSYDTLMKSDHVQESDSLTPPPRYSIIFN
ncbi:uncharacterized protein LOC135834623 [Planococcus citri]|uniref:uncharacterized protein LOC135834623 n=1 Tax=Planococcus citri TaxID=170843 RepID=UPI0031F98344